ncbi:MAG: hypothetical protein AAF206_11715 [Bacteroidota bacterium]
MKNILLFGLMLCLTGMAFGQKRGNLTLKRGTFTKKITRSSALTKQFKALTNDALGAKDDDDCTPPPCSGIIDPWTCECFDDIRDPWEEDKIAAHMKSVQRFEAAVLKGEGKDLIPASVVRSAQKRYPGNSLKAIVGRRNLYVGLK